MQATYMAFLLLASAGIAAAQPASFDVASIKPHTGALMFSTDPWPRGRTVTATAITLAKLIASAYALRDEQIAGGPAWLRTERYDLSAKSEGEVPLTRAEMRPMLQALLAERFQLKFHRETRQIPVYALVAAKNGPKLKASAADEADKSVVTAVKSGRHMETSRGTMEQLARQLSSTAGRPVVDRTGLTGSYTFTLDWLPAGAAADPDSNTPVLFTALQEQLGLKLEPAKAPFEMLVIDSAAQPSAN